ncbi:4-carboxy-4-hydroxy-2-oxoadipate aldolase/oxaloacetate decarboxylase [Ramlibacter sp. G-1-2-2]|uniref:4-carboxy-4-hydroxy-2-oxoadipate aldolase/oxaloacetate decarboxylase n=1 Tax=Ramlibacter agri TaxID=2728837 RepID=A0A848H6B9_9BURK|nr:4-carboxy-4-hydroxy-2-oxoadipate aldolase/oxaloacetate decarboxylase [Ramlibacter agri]NML44840.1 4-carboxy-4-hydroxy-2-oxoadipate aldolase/oxaloacetate decarboxylase [Ramlibacter agri]
MSASTVYLKVNRVAADIVERARELTVADIHESMGAAGRAALMDARMHPLQQGVRIAGPAVTAYCWPGDNLMMHRALNLAQRGDVLVVVCRAELSGAQWGDLATRHALDKGLAGVVVQGCVRDVDQVRELGFPVWATHVWAMHPEKAGHGTVNAPVICEGVEVRPGDLVVADGDGVVVVPRADADRVVGAAQAKMRREDDVIAAMRRGQPMWDAIGAPASYAKLEVREVDGAFDDAPR